MQHGGAHSPALLYWRPVYAAWRRTLPCLVVLKTCLCSMAAYTPLPCCIEDLFMQHCGVHSPTLLYWRPVYAAWRRTLACLVVLKTCLCSMAAYTPLPCCIEDLFMQHGGVHSPTLLYWRPVYAAWRRTLPCLVVLKTCLCNMAAHTPLPCCIEDLFMQHGGVHSPDLLYWRPVYAAWRRTLPCLVVLKTCLCSMAAHTPLPCCIEDLFMQHGGVHSPALLYWRPVYAAWRRTLPCLVVLKTCLCRMAAYTPLTCCIEDLFMQHCSVHSPTLLYWRPVYAAWRRTLPCLVVLKTCLCSMAAYTPLTCCIEDLFMQHGGVHSPALLYWRPVYAAWRRTLPCLVVLKTCLCSIAAYTPLTCCIEDLFMQHGGVHSPALLYWRPVYAAWRRTLPCLVVLNTCLCSMAAYTPLTCCIEDLSTIYV